MNFDESYFMGNTVKNPNPAGYGNYFDDPNLREPFQVLARNLISKLQILPHAKVLVVGCAFGFSVHYLYDLNIESYGMDISKFAVDKATGDRKANVLIGDARLEKDFEQFGVEKFDLIFDEDMICCLTDKEAKKFCEIANKYGSRVVHYLTAGNHLSKWYNNHTLQEWKEIIGGTDRWFERYTWNEE